MVHVQSSPYDDVCKHIVRAGQALLSPVSLRYPVGREQQAHEHVKHLTRYGAARARSDQGQPRVDVSKDLKGMCV